MADKFLLQSGAPDGFLLQDGSGVLLLQSDIPAGVKCLYNISQFRAGIAQVRAGLQWIEDELICAVAPSAFTVDAVAFNSDRIERGAALSGVSDSGDCIVSYWIKTTDVTGSTVFVGASGPVQANTGYEQFYDSIGTNGIFTNTSVSLTDGNWHHVLCALRMSTSTIQLYVDGSNVATGTTIDGTPVTAFFSDTNWAMCDTVGGGNPLTADISEFYFAPGQYLDISVQSNREKYRSPGGKPVDLGITGSTPTGSQPAVYLSVRPSDAATVWATNKGSGGNFTITGSLAIAATSPSD